MSGEQESPERGEESCQLAVLSLVGTFIFVACLLAWQRIEDIGIYNLLLVLHGRHLKENARKVPSQQQKVTEIEICLSLSLL